MQHAADMRLNLEALVMRMAKAFTLQNTTINKSLLSLLI